MGGDQRGADACIETHLLVDGAGVGLEGAGVPSFGLTEHRADQAVEQVDGLIGQAGGESSVAATSVACRRCRS